METVLITGASRGIGAATARLFAQKGWQVAIHYHASEEAAKKLVTEINETGGKALAFRADVKNGEEVQNMAEAVRVCLGKVSALVCCAGISNGQSLLTDTPEEDWDNLFAVNTKGAYNCLKAVLPGMVEQKSGSVVLVSSVWGVLGGSCEAAYSASKAALLGLTKALAKELGPSNIRVNCVAPGVIDTDMNAHLTKEDFAALCDVAALGRIGTPAEVARAIHFLASEDASFITGQILGVDGGFTG
ncbi:MAG: elongation factor P 5-aminopentanone reductase [Christensenellales bacterium]|jgi:3-oxoacyl-[acyl-carrier protein] reductase